MKTLRTTEIVPGAPVSRFAIVAAAEHPPRALRLGPRPVRAVPASAPARAIRVQVVPWPTPATRRAA